MKRAEGTRWTTDGPMILLLFLAAMVSGQGLAAGATFFADSGISGDCVGSYDPTTRSCGGGRAVAYGTLRGAVAVAHPGDTVLFRGGAFHETLSPPRSGASDNSITFKGYPGETATLSGVDTPAIFLFNRSNLVIEELTVTDVLGWGRVESSNNIILRNNRFSVANAHGTTGGLKFVKSRYNFVLNNTFDEGHDSLVLQESDRNVVDGNTFTKARHSLLSVRCGNFNVIRGNLFHNENQKAVEIYDCEGVSDAPVKFDATRHNLFEGNAFTYSRASDREYRYNGIQYGGQNGIVRRNVFYSNQGGALSFQVYPNEALYNNGNHVFNNTFYNNRCYGLSASSASDRGRFFGNVVKNNIFYKNTDCGGRANQTSIGNTTAVKFERNAILTAPPRFVDEARHDLRLAAGSPMIDAGAFATRAVGAGTGTDLNVEDVGYFYDGFGIPGEVGDEIRLEGAPSTARVVRIDYAKRALTLDQPLTWIRGQYLHLRYSGVGPDMGAFESQSETEISPPSMNPKINPYRR